MKPATPLSGLPALDPVSVKSYFPLSRDLPPSRAEQILDGLLNLIYPDSCFACSAPLARRVEGGICQVCWAKALGLRIVPPRCSSCGLPFQSFQEDSERLCGKCILEPPPYSGARAFGHYSAELSRLVQELKFRGRKSLAGMLAAPLAEMFFENWGREDFDLIVPVPLHSRRKRERGYNQSELLARSLARCIALPIRNALARARFTLPQVGLSDLQRKENVHNAFICREADSIAGARILLIDDVMTTGATAASASQALIDAGALRVAVLTVARA